MNTRTRLGRASPGYDAESKDMTGADDPAEAISV